MPKRLVDTEIWNKDWFLDLSIKQKLIVKFLFDKCDCAGVYEISYRTLRNCFNEEIKKEDFEGIKQVRFISENKIFLEDFIQFQYGITIDQLNEKNNVHKGILKSLSKNGIISTLIQPLANPCQRVLVKDMVKDKDKDIDKDNSSLLLSSLNEKKESKTNPDFYFSADKIKIFEIYENECKNLIPLTGEKRNRKILDKASNFLTEIDSDWDYYKKLCHEANYLKTIANTKIDFEMMLNCHIGIMNGKYQQDGNKRGVSQEFIDNFFENLRKEEAQNE